MGLLNLLLKDPLTFVLIAVPLLYAVIFHELAHGWVAYRLGDPTARNLGRLTLNPVKHLDLVGTLLLFIFGFGWAKPVPVNFNRLGGGRLGMMLVSAAGIIVNILMAFGALFVYRLLSLDPQTLSAKMLFYFARINIILAAFNLIPLPPLDGSKVLLSIAPPAVKNLVFRLERYGFLILIVLLYLNVLDPVIRFFQWMILTLIKQMLP
jgi:Zn-dependent protease